MSGAQRHLPGGLAGRIDVPFVPQPSLGRYKLLERRAGLMRAPTHAPQCLVEMRMRLDEAGNEERTAAILDN
jgi:hypothetical protein